jgi:hypothetical protein
MPRRKTRWDLWKELRPSISGFTRPEGLGDHNLWAAVSIQPLHVGIDPENRPRSACRDGIYMCHLAILPPNLAETPAVTAQTDGHRPIDEECRNEPFYPRNTASGVPLNT